MTSRLSALLICLSSASPATAQKSDDHFEKKVRPLLHAHCIKCHGPDKVKAGLRLDTAEGFAKGGESGPAVVAGDPDMSRLVRAVRGQDDLQMPPDKNLAADDVAVLAEWVKRGAVWPGYKAPMTPATPFSAADPLDPNAPALIKNLQAWYKADALMFLVGAAVVAVGVLAVVLLLPSEPPAPPSPGVPATGQPTAYADVLVVEGTRVRRYSGDGTLLNTFLSNRLNPLGVVRAESSGHILIGQHAVGTIHKYDADGTDFGPVLAGYIDWHPTAFAPRRSRGGRSVLSKSSPAARF